MRDEAGQALAMVIGLAMVFALGSALLLQEVQQQSPIVRQDLVVHQAYRAMVAGLDEYLYQDNANADFVTCNTANQGTGFCLAPTFGQWIQVQGTNPNPGSGPPSWFLLSNPQINTTTGVVSLTVVGMAGDRIFRTYQTAKVTITPLNSFLLNVLWINYNQIDPAVLSSSNPPTCGYNWQVGIQSGCASVNFITADSLQGNLYVNDSVFICGSPTFQSVHTADPGSLTRVVSSGCGTSTPHITGSQGYGVPVEPIPTDDSTLATVAARNGCLYEGPTTITLSGANMLVTSPDTPTGPPPSAPGGSTSNDHIDDPGNLNKCMPASAGGSVPIPANGVVFVENCLSGNATCTAAGAYNPMNGLNETGATGKSYGDAIVQGTVTGPLTIGAQNNVVIDGNICYTSTSGCASAPAAPSTDVLGLIAYNYVEVNHPVSGSNNVQTCGSGGAPAPPACDLSNPHIDAAILALNHSFLVNQYGTGAPLGTLNITGTVDEDWRGPVGTSNGGSIVTGYAKNYVYDPRFVYLSPPYYLNPGTAAWGIASLSVSGGTCTLPSPQTCPTPP
ncbi:MAG TPA: hypothetical protein VMU09_10120 [Acidimicrobiales bacterium]|nr:hypothetical protein [Acidimicrobiales bacterium]